MKQRIFVGLKFKSKIFSASVEVKAIREKLDEVDVELTSTDGLGWMDYRWPLYETQTRFQRGIYTEIKPDTANVSVW